MAGHFLADFTLQPKYMIADKYKLNQVIGWLTLTAHAATHFLVSYFLLSFLGIAHPFALAFGIGLTHFLIDYGKISGAYGVLLDQVLHWLVLLVVVLCASLF